MNTKSEFSFGKCDPESDRYCLCPNCGKKIDLGSDRCVSPNYSYKKIIYPRCSGCKKIFKCYVDSGRPEREKADYKEIER